MDVAATNTVSSCLQKERDALKVDRFKFLCSVRQVWTCQEPQGPDVLALWSLVQNPVAACGFQAPVGITQKQYFEV